MEKDSGPDMCNSARLRSTWKAALLLSTLALLATLPRTCTLHADASQYVEVFDGDMPLMFAVGHGGWKDVGDLKNASGDFASDMLLRDYFYGVLMVRLYEKTGHIPYIVYQQGKRNYVNTNRRVGDPEAYHCDNTEARDAYFEFHNQVDAMIARIESTYGADMALMINPHSSSMAASLGNRPWDRIAEIGFIASVTNLGSAGSTMKALYDRKGQAALRGEDSIPYQLFHGQDWPTPDAFWPEAATVNSKALARTGDDVWHVLPAWVTGYNTDDWSTAYFNGSRSILYHGTNTSTWGRYADWQNGLDAFQLEVNYTREAGIALDQPGRSQLDVPFVTALMDDLIDAILHCLRVNYSWRPGGVYDVVVDNGDAGFDTTGSWSESEGQGFWGTPSIYTVERGATASWTPDLALTGTYEVRVRWTNSGTRTDDARYTVHYAGGSRTFHRDQSGDQDAKWVRLGQFRFDAGTSGSVVLESTDARSTAADAVMFRMGYSIYEYAVYLPVALRDD